MVADIFDTAAAGRDRPRSSQEVLGGSRKGTGIAGEDDKTLS